MGGPRGNFMNDSKHIAPRKVRFPVFPGLGFLAGIGGTIDIAGSGFQHDRPSAVVGFEADTEALYGDFSRTLVHFRSEWNS